MTRCRLRLCTVRTPWMPSARAPFAIEFVSCAAMKLRLAGGSQKKRITSSTGIVASVSAVLAQRGVNVASLESRVQNAPLSGTPLFVLNAEIQVPSEVAVSALRKELATVCDEKNLDFLLEAA